MLHECWNQKQVQGVLAVHDFVVHEFAFHDFSESSRSLHFTSPILLFTKFFSKLSPENIKKVARYKAIKVELKTELTMTGLQWCVTVFKVCSVAESHCLLGSNLSTQVDWNKWCAIAQFRIHKNKPEKCAQVKFR